MRRALTLSLLVLFIPATGQAQAPVRSLTSQAQPVRLSVQPTYQRYEDGGESISAWSVPVAAVVPLGRHFNVSLRTSVVTAQWRSRLSGLDDVRASLGYTRSVGKGSLALTLGVNVPVGKAKLSPEEVETAALLAQNVYDFRVPGLGQGLNVSPSLTYAFPIGEDVAVGLGAAYQYRGSYDPQQNQEASYDPGNEVLLTGGLDVRLAPTATLSGDVTYTFYGNDALDGNAVYEAGDKITSTLQFVWTQEFNELRLLARYRSRARSSLPVAGGAGLTEVQAVPDQIRASGRYELHLSDAVSLAGLVRGRLFGETERFSARRVLDLGVAPEFALSSTLDLQPRLIYTLGGFSGVEAGLGLEMNL